MSTPPYQGPWLATSTNGVLRIIANEGTVCTLPWDGPPPRANAALIAAAPDMYAALRGIHNYLGLPIIRNITLDSVVLAMIESALHKAEGQEP
jgi:Mg2+/citrate symporter